MLALRFGFGCLGFGCFKLEVVCAVDEVVEDAAEAFSCKRQLAIESDVVLAAENALGEGVDDATLFGFASRIAVGVNGQAVVDGVGDRDFSSVGELDDCSEDGARFVDDLADAFVAIRSDELLGMRFDCFLSRIEHDSGNLWNIDSTSTKRVCYSSISSQAIVVVHLDRLLDHLSVSFVVV